MSIVEITRVFEFVIYIIDVMLHRPLVNEKSLGYGGIRASSRNQVDNLPFPGGEFTDWPRSFSPNIVSAIIGSRMTWPS